MFFFINNLKNNLLKFKFKSLNRVDMRIIILSNKEKLYMYCFSFYYYTITKRQEYSTCLFANKIMGIAI